MKISQLLITALLVAGGIVVYDVLRQEPDPEMSSGVVPARETVEAPHTPEVLAPLHLKGSGEDPKWEELDRRLTLLEQSLDAEARFDVVLDPGSTPPDSTRPAGGEPDTEQPTEGASDERDGASRVSEAQRFLNPLPAGVEELRDFRKRLEWVERQRRIEKDARGISTWLDRQGVTLTPEQRLEVVRAALVYKARANRLPKAPPDDEAAQEAQRASRVALREEFVDSLYDRIPRAEADRIVVGMEEAADAARRAKEQKEADQK